MLVLFFVVHYSKAQYADLGSGALKNEIWWFDWAGITVSNGASRTFTTTDGLTVNITFSNVSATVPVPDVMNTWSGAVLHFLYDFSNPAIQPALHSRTSTSTVSFTLNITATRGGAPAPFTFVGADAEGSIPSEVTTFTTDGTNWQTFDFYRNSSQTTNPLSGCNTQTVSIDDTWGGASQIGQNPLVGTRSPTGSMKVDVTMQRGALGGMAVAFGIFAPVDRGDLAASYGFAQHGLVYNVSNPCNYLPPLPAATPSQALHLGAVSGDADPVQTLDDNASGADEDGVINFNYYNNTGQYQVQVLVTNNTGATAYISGWFDYNRNGVFDSNESGGIFPVSPVMNSIYFQWSVPTYLPIGNANGYAFRFRITSDPQAAQNPAGYAPDGEVEDYYIPETALCAPLSIATIPDTTICTGQSLQLTTTGNAVNYSWNTPAYLSDPNIASPVASPTSNTKYIVTGSTPQGCTTRDSVTVTVTPGPVTTISNDVTICPGSSTQLAVNATGTPAYSWSPAAGLNNAAISNPVASPTATTDYIVTVSDGNGCKVKDTVTVTVLPPPVFSVQPAQPVLCKTQSVVLTASGGNTYTWLLEDNSVAGTSSSLSVQPDSSQVYRVQITDACGASTVLSVPVAVNELPAPTITKSNDIDCSDAHGQAVLHVTGGSGYVWDPAPGITDVTSDNQVVTPAASTTYYVTVTNSNGCTTRDSVTVQVDLSKGANTFAVPNAFTPNNDGKNDCFGPARWGRVTGLQFQVFNRWGQQVFSSSNPGDCWDGRFKGVLQPTGGYPYIINATTICGKVSRKGIVMLVR